MEARERELMDSRRARQELEDQLADVSSKLRALQVCVCVCVRVCVVHVCVC